MCAAENRGSPRRLRGGVDFPRNEHEYRRWFGTEEQALTFMEWLRWPDGFVCPECEVGGRKSKRGGLPAFVHHKRIAGEIQHGEGVGSRHAVPT